MTAEEIRKVLDNIKQCVIKETNDEAWMNEYTQKRGKNKLFFLKISLLETVSEK